MTAFESAWDFLSTLNKEFVDDDFCPKCQGTGDQDEYNWKRESFECDKCDGKGRGFFDDVDDDYVLPIKEREDLTEDDFNYLTDMTDMEFDDYVDEYLADLANPYHARTRDFGYTHKIPYFTRSEDVIEDVWTLMKSIPTDIMNDPLVYISPDGMIKTVRLEMPFRKWLYDSGYPTDDDFAQLSFMQKIQILFHYRVEQAASKEKSFMEGNI